MKPEKQNLQTESKIYILYSANNMEAINKSVER